MPIRCKKQMGIFYVENGLGYSGCSSYLGLMQLWEFLFWCCCHPGERIFRSVITFSIEQKAS